VAWFNSGQTGELICAYDTEDGKEFFALGWRLANAVATSDMWMFFKDNNNEWAAMFSDGGTVNCTFWDSVCSTPFRNVGATLDAGQSTAGVLEPLALAAGGTTGLVAGSSFRQRVVAANPSLFITNLSSNFGFGKWANVTAGGKVVCLGNGPLWIKTP
jgi:hypothetical protein